MRAWTSDLEGSFLEEDGGLEQGFPNLAAQQGHPTELCPNADSRTTQQTESYFACRP